MTNFYWYISKRISSGKGFKKGFSRPIIHIATGAVALGIAVMLISIAIVIGFQNEVRDKVVGFGSHVQISQNSGAQSKESIPMLTNDSLVSEIKKISSVKHVQKFAIKPGILETKKDVEGAIIKGVSSDFDWTFFNDKLVKGTTLSADSLEVKKHIMLSETIAKRLRISVGERLTVYFVLNQEDLKPRTFKVVGIYNSGFVEFDEQFVFVPLDIMAKISKWGIESQIKVTEEKEKNRWKVEGFGFGGEGLLKFEWSKMKWRGSGPHYLSYKDTSRIELIVRGRFETIPDTSRIMFSVDGEDPLRLLPLVVSSGGTHSEYCGGYEVLLTDYESILNADDALTFSLPYYYRSDTILSRFPEIFNWLATLDINVIILIILMIFVAIINIASAILIIIIEKTSLIGLFKAFGASTTRLSGLFIVLAGRILVIGLIVGNILGLGFCILQDKFGLVKLDPEKYILDKVPIDLNWTYVCQINLITLVICVLFMILPVLYVSRIDPVRAIKFD